MTYLRYFFIFMLFLSAIPLLSQEGVNSKYHPDYPILIRPQNHDPYFTDFPEKSFYESRNNWQAIIDSTWGSGLPLADKLLLFDQYATAVQEEFDGFLSLGMDGQAWDSLRDEYRGQLNDSTSRGRFSAIMSHLARNLQDAHTQARDRIVIQTPLNPGVPVLVLSAYVTVEHFGAVITALPDSSLLVLRAVPNHPLGLQPGDIILGYEGIAWKILVQELLQVELPFFPSAVGAPSADIDFILLGAGMNWHLFNTIDLIEYSTGDTLHLPVAPMINLNVPPMLNNEQVEIPGIPFPDYFNDQIVSYGIINNTNIGYIYLYRESPTATADQQFAQAVNSLRDTEGLIIDMRLNYGGWALFDEAFDVLFNDFTYTIEDAYRSSTTSLSLTPSGNGNLFWIDANPDSLYDHPIAVLLGPTCISMGDITAQRFRYHPTVRFFGKSPGASMGDNLVIDNNPDWYLRYSISDMFHLNQSGHYLNRVEFPIDYPVWHNPTDVANGVDAVAEKALDWMTNLVYGHDVSLNDNYFVPTMDTINIEAIIQNPNSYTVSSKIFINTFDSTFIDSVNMYRTFPGDTGEIWMAKFPAPPIEDYIWISISAYDSVNNEKFTTRNVNRFVTFGPIVNHSMQLVDSYKTGPFYFFEYELILRNDGQTTTVPHVRADLSISSIDYTIMNNNQVFGDIAAGQTSINPQNYLLRTRQDSILIDTLDIQFSFLSDDILYWQTKGNLIVNLNQYFKNIPDKYNLSQNYPNPFNPTTTIEFDLPKRSEVNLKVFNILGEEVAILVSDRLSTGSYSYEWDASNLASGVYLYRLQAGDPSRGAGQSYVETKKMVLMR